MTKADAEKDLDAFIESIATALKSGDEIYLGGFDSFSVSAREGRNPRTGETIAIAASNQPKFTAGKGLKAAVNG